MIPWAFRHFLPFAAQNWPMNSAEEPLFSGAFTCSNHGLPRIVGALELPSTSRKDDYLSSAL
jgi:hypothetical protein